MTINNVLPIFKIYLESKKPHNAQPPISGDDNFSPGFRQSITASGPLLLTVVVGMTLGYSAVLLPQLQEVTNTNNGIIINKEEASWVASLAILPMAAGTLIGGLFIQKYGRKKTHIITCLPCFAGWLLIHFALNLEMLLTGRFLTGLSSGMIGPATGIYIGETSEPKYRGVLLGGIPLSVSIGLLVVHLLGTFLTWRTTALITCLLPLVSWGLMVFTPESPAWLAQQDLPLMARSSFYWLRGGSEESKQELEQILAKQKQFNDSPKKSVMSRVRELLVPEFWKPMCILLVFFITSQWAGVNAVNFYSLTFMKQTLGNSVNEYLATFIIDCIRLVSSIISCILLRKIGRRPLALMGGIGTLTPLFVLSAYIYSSKIFHIENIAVPVTCLLTYTFFVTAGFATLAWNLLGELLPMANKSTGSGIASFVAYVSAFSVVKTMPAMFEGLGTEGTFLAYGSMALIGTVFVGLTLPETRGKTLHDIEEYFRSKSTEGPSSTRL